MVLSVLHRIRLWIALAAVAARALPPSQTGLLEDSLSCDQSVHLLQSRAVADRRHSAPQAADVFVLDVSAPRSGTQSFFKALEILGLRPLHTGYNRTARPLWNDYLFGNGTLTEALSTLRGHHAAMDEPMQLLYKDFLRVLPDAKFVLHPVHQSPQDWYRSVLRLLKNGGCFTPDTVEGLDDYVASGEVRAGPVIDPSAQPAHHLNPILNPWDTFQYWGCRFDSAVQTRAEVHHCLDMYVAHEQAVRREIPADKLLVFDMKEGWAPLCSFLDLPVPSEPFPHEDEFGEPTDLCKFWNGLRKAGT